MQPSWKAYTLCKLQKYLKYGDEMGHMWFWDVKQGQCPKSRHKALLITPNQLL